MFADWAIPTQSNRIEVKILAKTARPIIQTAQTNSTRWLRILAAEHRYMMLRIRRLALMPEIASFKQLPDFIPVGAVVLLQLAVCLHAHSDFFMGTA